MKKFFQTLLTILLIVFFPLGILFCVGKNLFSGGFTQFLGGILLFAAGAVLAIYFLRYDLIEPVIVFVQNTFQSIIGG